MATLQETQIERLVRDNVGLIRSLVAKTMRNFPYLPGGYDRDDLESFGYIGLVQAAQTFDPNRGVQFSTYAYHCIENEISGALVRARNRQIDCISLNVMIGEDEDTPLEEQIPDDGPLTETIIIDQESHEALKEAVGKLPSPHAEIISQMYFEGKPLATVARDLKLSAQRVQFLHSRALRMLRRHVRPLR